MDSTPSSNKKSKFYHFKHLIENQGERDAHESIENDNVFNFWKDDFDEEKYLNQPINLVKKASKQSDLDQSGNSINNKMSS